MMTSFEVRKRFFNFFTKNQHELEAGSSLIPKNDPSLLFANAGMNQFKDIFLGLKNPPAKNVITVQKCLRAGGKHNDLENVGETPLHHTFFEMLGNFSFGGYFKEQAIAWAWEFLTKELSIPPERLWVTVHSQDEASYQIWRDKQKIPQRKIYKLGDKDNFWQMGETGPCGYCSEIHYYDGKERQPAPGQLMEIWNLVFMEFNDTAEGKREKLSLPCVDTGMGLERLCAILQNKPSNYHADPFLEIILALEKACDFQYDFKERRQTEREKAFRVVADHSRAVAFLISAGALPGSAGAEYVLRRIMRRALYYSQKLNPKENLLLAGAKKTIELMSNVPLEFKEGIQSMAQKLKRGEKELIELLGYSPELKTNEREMEREIKGESRRFSSLLKAGQERLERLMSSAPSLKGDRRISAETVGTLYETYGFPIDLTRLIVNEHNKKRKERWTIAEESEIRNYTPKSKTYLQFKEIERELPKRQPEFVNESPAQGQIDQIIEFRKPKLPWDKGHEFESAAKRPQRLPALKKNQKGWALLDKTSLHPGDSALLKTNTGQAIVKCLKFDNYILHIADIVNGEIKAGQAFQMEKPALKNQPASLAQKQWENFKKETDSLKAMIELLEPERKKTIWTGYKKSLEKGAVLNTLSLAPPSAKQEGPKSAGQMVFGCIPEGSNGYVVTDRTCFYPEGGGPIGDKGWLRSDTGHVIAEVLDCQKKGDCIVHEVRALKEIQRGQTCFMEADKNFREGVKSAHSATHLLNSALRQVLGSSVRQAGSLVEPHRLRFDFTYPRPLTKKERDQIEDRVWQSLLAEEEVSAERKSFDQAEKEGALFLKDEKKYGEEVRVINIGSQTSKELCGGIHVQNTREIKDFKIILETGVKSGVRRISAYTGALAKAWERFLIQQNLEWRKRLSLPAPDGKAHEEDKALKGDLNHLTAEDSNKAPSALSKSKKPEREKTRLSESEPSSAILDGDSHSKKPEREKTRLSESEPSSAILDGDSHSKKPEREKTRLSESEPSSAILDGDSHSKKPTLDENKKQPLSALEGGILQSEDSHHLSKKISPLRFERKGHLWKGWIEKQNPFLKRLEENERRLKALRKRVIHLGEGKSSLKGSLEAEGSIKERAQLVESNQEWRFSASRLHPLARQNLELRERLKIPLPALQAPFSHSSLLDDNPPRESSQAYSSSRQPSDLPTHPQPAEIPRERESEYSFEDRDSPLDWIEAKERETQNLKAQAEKIQSLHLEKDKLADQAAEFSLSGEKGRLLALSLPVADRKLLADLSDSLLSKLSSGVVILLGQGESQAPVLVNITKNFQNILSAGDILKNIIAPLCQGKGGGKASFAQGSVNCPSAFLKVERMLLDKWAKS